jgi:large subunit ribosomal protein L17
MRHRVDHRKLNRTASHRKAMLCNMVTSLFDHERITTTDAKAKEARRLAERLITRARKGYTAHQEVQSLKDAGKEDEARQMAAVALAHWRQAGRYVRNTSVLRKLFEQLAPLYIGRDGGYTRIIRMDNRLGDNARTVLLELVGTEKTEKPKGAAKTEEAEAPEKAEKDKKATRAKSKTKSKSKASGKKAGEKADKAEKPKKKAKAKTKSKAKSKAKSDGKSDKKKSTKKD